MAAYGPRLMMTEVKMTADIQFVYLRREERNYRISLRIIGRIAYGQYWGRSGDVIWWMEGDQLVGFEYVREVEPPWVECADDEIGYKSGLYDNGLPVYAPRDEVNND
jgi:hypothetical protein